MKIINIYLTENEKTELNKIRAKYKVSLSTIADKVCFYLYKYIRQYPTHEQNLNDLMDHYISNNGNVKSSIKPKCFNEGILKDMKDKNVFVTNCLKIYANNIVGMYLTHEGKNRFYNEINNEFQKTKEMYWNYNATVRNTARAIRNNKEYYRRILND